MAITRHTALASGVIEQGEELDEYRVGYSVAFRHDICTGLPAIYKDCDVFFLDPPWKRGFDLFNARAKNPTAFTYLQFMAQLSTIILGLNRPTYVITGKSEIKRLPVPAFTQQIKRDGEFYLLAGYHATTPIPANSLIRNYQTPEGLLSQLAQQHNCIGDFLAGYGAAAVAFHQAKKQFIVSDFVPSCIGVIKKRILQVEGRA